MLSVLILSILILSVQVMSILILCILMLSVLIFQRKLTTVCTICSGPSSSHLHYGAVACYSCRAFFRRGIGKSYCCVEGTGDCNIDWTCRRSCQWCRFDK